MMRKLLLLIIVCSANVLAQEGGVRVLGEPYKIADGVDEYYMNVRWSPDGTRLAFTGMQYHGLYLMNLDDGSIERISDEMAAGFGFQWSSDSKFIASRVSRYEGVRRHNAIKIFDIDSRTERSLTEYLPYNTGIPQWVDGDEKIAVDGTGSLKLLETGITASPLRKQNSVNLAVLSRNGVLSIADIRTNSINKIDPFPGETYLNAVISPDGSKITFEVLGGNLYVINTDGTNLVDLGKGNRPQWAPDGEYIVYMIADDDGHRITSSDITAIRTDGTWKTVLTERFDPIAMNPSWSPDGGRIAFDVIDEGAIYVMEIAR
jgi:Tol biopolymer transport system component